MYPLIPIYRRSPFLFCFFRLQQDVRALRPLHRHVLLPQQAHDDRLGHRKQQQDQLGHGRQAGWLDEILEWRGFGFLTRTSSAMNPQILGKASSEI